MIRRIWLATVALLVLIVLVWIAALWVPTNQRLDRALDRRDAAQVALDDLDEQRQALVVANRDVPVLQTQLVDLTAAIPDEPALAALMLAVADAEAESGVDVTAVTNGDPVTDDGDLVTIGVDIDVQASYFQLLDFMNRLSRQERLYVIDGVEIDALGDEVSTKPPELDVVLHGRVFVAGDGEPVEVPQPVELEPAAEEDPESSTSTTTSTTEGGQS